MGRCFQVICRLLLKFIVIDLFGLAASFKNDATPTGSLTAYQRQFAICCCLTKWSFSVSGLSVRFLQRYVQRETESMQSSKSNVTASTLTTRQKKMAEMCSLIKYFIRCANKRECTVVTIETTSALVRWASFVQKTLRLSEKAV